MASLEALKTDLEACRKRALAQEAQAAESWKTARGIEVEIQKLENVQKFRKEMNEEKL